VHCVEDTPGSSLIGELDDERLDVVVLKGRDARVEMYSGFADMFGNKGGASADLAKVLREKQVTHVYAVGLTGDCCVKHTALDAKKDGFETFVLRDGVKSVDEGEGGWGVAVREFRKAGVEVVESSAVEVEWVRALRQQ
jgi:nicotinamidase-related amidase